ncbi:MAG: serine hydrolase [Patescibacteria group bacterium]
MNDNNHILGNRRVVIVFQLLLLLVILSGLFGTFLLDKRQSANVTEAVPLNEAPLSELNKETLAELSEVEVRAKAAYVFDVTRKEALYSKNEESVLPLASITKLMTSLLAYELAAVDTTTELSSRAARQEGSNLVAGEKFTLDELNRLALVSSSNSAAYELSASVGSLLGDRDPTAQFVEGMNIKAAELKLESLAFKNPTGLDISPTEPGAVGSAKDVSLLMDYILKEHPELLEATTRGGARIYNSQGEYHDVENTNEILYAVPNLIGSKTGYTDLAGGNLTIAFDAGMNRTVIITVLGSTREERFSDVLRLVRATQSHISDL